MPDTAAMVVFLGAAIAMLIVPGPAVLYIIARSVDQGPLAGIVSTLGIGVGTLFHTAGAVLGLSAILASSAVAFAVVKYLGAAYLIYLGVKRLLTKDSPHTQNVQPQPLWKIFRQGIMVNLLNPKTALFMLAFLPQFVDPARGSVSFQILLLGLILFGLGTLSDGAYALVAGKLGHWLKTHPRFLAFQRYFTGGVFLALGIGAALADSGRK